MNKIVNDKVIAQLQVFDELQSEISKLSEKIDELESTQTRDRTASSEAVDSLRRDVDDVREQVLTRCERSEQRLEVIESQQKETSAKALDCARELTIEEQLRRELKESVDQRCGAIEVETGRLGEMIAREGKQIVLEQKRISDLESAIDLLRVGFSCSGKTIFGNETTEFERTVASCLADLPLNCRIRSVPFESLETSNGLIHFLRSEETPFNRQIVVSQSSNDLIDLIEPDRQCRLLGCISRADQWLEFKFWSSIEVNGLKMRKMSDHPPPRSFDIIDVDHGRTLASVPDADFTRDEDEFELRFESVRTTALKIQQTGPNWNNGNGFHISTIEFLSPDPTYSSGVCRTLFTSHKSEIRKYIEVHSLHFNPDTFHLLNPSTALTTCDDSPAWVQIEIVSGLFFVRRYRLKRNDPACIRSWSLRGSNDTALPLDKCTVIDRREEASRGDFDLLASFETIGGPFKFFRIVHEGLRWDGKLMLRFAHFDIFGVFIQIP
jgi:hypothetical protein